MMGDHTDYGRDSFYSAATARPERELVRHHADRIHTKIRCVFYQLSAASTTWRKFSVCQCCHLHHLLPLLLATPTLLCIEVINCS